MEGGGADVTAGGAFLNPLGPPRPGARLFTSICLVSSEMAIIKVAETQRLSSDGEGGGEGTS